MARLIALLTLAAGFNVFVQPAGADGAPDPARVTIHRLLQPVRVDGRIDEAAWEGVAPLPMTMYRPTFEGTPTERTEVRIAHDDQFLYVSGRFYDSDRAGVRANAYYRDEQSGSDEFMLLLDTFDDNENALVFWTGPTGMRGDLAIANDGQSSNVSWNTYWDVAATQDEQGWSAEMRIPFSSLGFQSDGGRVQMGLTAVRTIARKNEQVVYPAIPPSWSLTTPSQAADVVFERVRSRKPVYVSPYALGGLGQTPRLNDGDAAYRRQDDFARDLGLDVKYNLTSNLTLDVTVNTDFAQAEADDQQINLTRYSLFFPEKRAFFQERSGIFAFNTRNERLFHSRRIGLHEGQAVPILGGARLAGRVGDWEVGLLDIQTARHDAAGLPSENFGVLRLRREVLNANSTAGGILTSRTGLDGSHSIAYGLDGDIRLFAHEYLSLNWAQTFGSGSPSAGPQSGLRSGLLELGWQRRRLQGWSYTTSLTRMGPDFDPAVGFVQRRDYTELAWLLHYNGFPGAASAFNRTMPFHFQGAVALRNTDRTVESATADYLAHWWWKGGTYAGATGSVSYEDLRTPLHLPRESEVPAGAYGFASGQVHFSTPQGRKVRTTVMTDLGTFYDGWRFALSAGPQWNASRHLALSAAYGLDHVRFPDRRQGFDAHLVRLRAQYALNTRLSVHGFAQYNSAADVVTTNVRFRYSLREGNDLWVVYNEGLNTDRARLYPELPLSSGRTVLVKYTYTFGL